MMQLPGALRWKVVRVRHGGWQSAITFFPILSYRPGHWTEDFSDGFGVFVFRERQQADTWHRMWDSSLNLLIVPVWCQGLKLDDCYLWVPEGTERFTRAFPLEVKE